MSKEKSLSIDEFYVETVGSSTKFTNVAVAVDVSYKVVRKQYIRSVDAHLKSLGITISGSEDFDRAMKYLDSEDYRKIWYDFTYRSLKRCTNKELIAESKASMLAVLKRDRQAVRKAMKHLAKLKELESSFPLAAKQTDNLLQYCEKFLSLAKSKRVRASYTLKVIGDPETKTFLAIRL